MIHLVRAVLFAVVVGMIQAWGLLVFWTCRILGAVFGGNDESSD